MIPQSHLPEYVERGGEQVWRPPASARNVDLYGFVVEANRDAIDELLQRCLVRPTGGAVDYRCAYPGVIVTVGTIGRESSLDPRDSRRGYLSEKEVSVWCLVADMKARNRLLWFLPYIFTDSEQTIATGREIFGYPKQLGYFEDDYPNRLGPGGGTTKIATLAIDRFGENAKAEPLEILRVTRKRGRRTQSSADSLVSEFTRFFEEMDSPAVNPSLPSGRPPQAAGAIVHRGARAPAPPHRRTAAPWIRAVLDTVQGKTLNADPTELIVDMVTHTTLVFLKQFRDVACATKACYQAVIEAPLAIDPFGATYEMLDPKQFGLTFRSRASDPLADELGIRADRSQTPQRAFHARFGFDIELGLEVWRAPT